MNDSIPNNVFIPDNIKRQINKIVDFRNELKKKYVDVFQDKDTYLALDFAILPEPEKGGQKLSFTPLYSNNLPDFIKEEFESFLAKYLIK